MKVSVLLCSMIDELWRGETLTPRIYIVLAGAAAFAAMHKYEQHLRDTGKPVNHSTMKASTAIISLSHSFSYLLFESSFYAIMHAACLFSIIYMATSSMTLGVHFSRSRS